MNKDYTDAANYASRTVAGLAYPDDILQATAESLLQAGHDLDKVDRALVFTVAKRRAVDITRKIRDTPVALQESKTADRGAMILRTMPSQVEQPETMLDKATLIADLRSHVVSVLADLDGKERAVAAEYYAHGLDANEAAQALGWKPTLVRKWLMRARESLGPYADDLEIVRAYFYPGARASEGAADAVATPRLRALFTES